MFQVVLDGLGSILAWLYSLIGNYGVAIILLTLMIRVLLIPLGIKQIRSMQAMQSVQPKVKALQQKYKANRQKLNEEMMKLYKEHGVNPFSGCLPILAQFPVLIALFAVLQFPNVLTHVPRGSELETAIKAQHTRLLGMNMLCSAGQAGTKVVFPEERIPPTRADDFPTELDCGAGIPARIPYYLLAGAMIATTFYSQRQMQKASPGASQQQQTLTRLMPLLFGVWGFFFPAGLVVYWTTTNLVQIGQQRIMLRQTGGRASSEPATSPPPSKGRGQASVSGDGQPQKDQEKQRSPKPGQARVGRWTDTGQQVSPRKSPSGSGQRSGNQGGRSGAGGRSAGDRKKRRKR